MASSQSLKETPTWELVHTIEALRKSLTRPEEIEVLDELRSRLEDYSKINAGFVVSAQKDKTHTDHIEKLQNAVGFYGNTVNILGSHSMIDFSQPAGEWWKGVSTGIAELKSKVHRLRVTIGEIYCMHRACGDVIALSILPDDVQETVTASMKARKLRLD
jgi:hypothetical protein